MKGCVRRLAALCVVLAVIFSSSVSFAKPADSNEYEYRYPFSSDISMTGRYSQMSESFVTGNWDILEASLFLEYAATPLIPNQKASLTVLLNGNPVISVPVVKSQGARQSVRISLPARSIQAKGANTLSFQADFRSDGEACVDAASQSNWLNVFRESAVQIRYRPLTPCTNIAEFYQCFSSIEALSNHQSAFFVPQNPNVQELTALALAGGISSAAVVDYQNLTLLPAVNAQELQKKKYAVYVSGYERLLPEIKAAMSQNQQELAQKGAVLALVRSGNTHLLVLTGTGDLSDAGIVLSNPDFMRQFLSDTKALSNSEEYRMPESAVAQYVPLTESGVLVKGNFRQTADFYVEYPKNRTLSESSEMSLDFHYAENLDFTRSLVTVFLNDQPVASKKLTKEYARGDHLVFSLPDTIKITGSFSVKITFDLSAGENWCELTAEEMPWAYVEKTSMLKLNSVDQSEFLFENFPSPFVRDGSLDHLVILLPDSPNQADLTVMNRVMMTLGRYAKDNRGSVRAAFFSQPGDLKEANVIAIGTASRNKIVTEQKELLPFSFQTDGSTVLSNSKMLVDPEYGTTLGIGQIVRSPYSGTVRKALLVLTGANDSAMLQTADSLGTEQGLWALTGNAFAADSDEVFCYEYPIEEGNSSMPAKKSSQPSDNRSVLIGMAASVFSLALLSAGLLWMKYRRKRDL